MDNIEKDIELGIIQGKSIKWVEPHEYILGTSVIVKVPLNKYIKWIRKQKKLHKTNVYFKRRTIEVIDYLYIIHWAWVE